MPEEVKMELKKFYIPEEVRAGKQIATCLYSFDKNIIIEGLDGLLEKSEAEIKKIEEHKAEIEKIKQDPEDLKRIWKTHIYHVQEIKRRTESTPECE